MNYLIQGIYLQVAAFGEAGVDLDCETGRVVKAAQTLIHCFNQASSNQGGSSHLDPLAASHAVKLLTKYGVMPDHRKVQEHLKDQQDTSHKQLIEDLEALVEENGTLQETALLAGAAIVALIQVRIFNATLF